MTNDFDRLFDIAQLALATRNWAQAAAGFERCVQLRPDSAPAWGNLSIAYWRLGDTTRQLEAARRAIKAGPRLPPAWLVLSEAWRAVGREDEALRAAQTGLKLSPSEPTLLESAATAQRRLGHPKKAIEAARRAIRYTPFFNSLMHALIGDCFRGLRQWAAALKQYQSVIENQSPTPGVVGEPPTVSAWRGKGVVYLLRGIATRNNGDLREAIGSFEQVLEWNARDVKSWGGIGVANRFLDRNEASLDAIDRAIRFGGKDDYLALQRGLTLSELGRDHEAVEELDAAAENAVDPAVRSEALTYRPLALGKLGRHDETIAACDRAISEGVENPVVWNTRAIVWLHRKEYDRAEKDLTRAHELAPDDPVVINNLGWLAIERGDYDKGDRLIDQALSAWRTQAGSVAANLWVAKYLSLFRQERFAELNALAARARRELESTPELLKRVLEEMEEARLTNTLSLAVNRIEELETAIEAMRAETGLRPELLRHRLAEFESLLNKPGVREEEIKQFLKSEASRPIFSLECVRFHTEHELGAEFQADFVLEYSGQRYVMVEIENPNRRLYTRRGQPTAELAHARQQVEDWQQWVEENNPYAQKRLPGCVSPEGQVIIGRRSSLTTEHQTRLARSNVNTRGRLMIRTYDDLLESARAVVANIEATQPPPTAGQGA
jgi:tetratricopeptide (TPR) repeat protein